MRAPLALLLAALPLVASCAGSPPAPAEPPEDPTPAAAPDGDTAPEPGPVEPASPVDPASLDLSEMVRETRVVQTNEDAVRLVWWIPVEYWETTFAMQGSRVDPAEAQVVLDALRPFALFGVATADVGPEGALRFTGAEELREALRLETPTGRQVPFAEDEMPPALAKLLAGMRPALSRAVGELGPHMHLFVFANRSETGEPLASPRQAGFAELVVGEQGFRWTLPLGSFLPPKTCPVDQEPMSGAWTYCPRHGVQLE